MLSMIERVRQLEFLWILGAKYPRVHSRQVCELKVQFKNRSVGSADCILSYSLFLKPWK